MISYEQINSAVEAFDAEKVHYVMSKLGWTWTVAPSPASARQEIQVPGREALGAPWVHAVPSAAQIRSTARDMVRTLVRFMDGQPINVNRTYTLESGGLCVRIWFENRGALQRYQQASMQFVPKLQIDFVVTQGEA